MDDKVTTRDIEDTLRAAGIKVMPDKAPAATDPSPAADAVSDKDIQDTLSAAGIKLGKESNQPKRKGKVPENPPMASGLGPEAEAEARRGAKSMTHLAPVIEGIPVVGAMPRLAGAAIAAGTQPVTGMGMPGETFGERFNTNERVARRASELYADDNQLWSILGNLAGGTMAGGMASRVPYLGAALGARGPNWGARTVTGGTGSAAIGAADAALRGEDPGFGATVGGAGGVLAPAIGEAARGATRFVSEAMWPRKDALRGISRTNVDRMVRAMEGETPRSVVERRRDMGPAGMLMDLNPEFTDLAGGLADTPGLHKSVVRQAVRDRSAGQRGRMETVLDNNIAPRIDIEQFKDHTTEARKKAADPLYELWRTTVIEPNANLDALIPRLKAAGAFKMADELADITGDSTHKAFLTGATVGTGGAPASGIKMSPTTQTWDYVKRGLDRSIDAAYSKGDKTLGRELVKLKNEMIDEIEATPAGAIWKQARTEFAEHSELIDQIERGRDTFLGGRSGMSVAELKQELKGIQGPALVARIQGMRSAVADAMGETAIGDTTMRNKLLAPNSIEKMELMIGKKNTAEIVKSLKQEKFLKGQDQNISGGSQTTPKKERVNALQPQPTNRYDPDFTRPLSLVPAGLRDSMRPAAIMDAYKGVRNEDTLNELAQLLKTPEGKALSNLLKGLMRESGRREAVNRGAQAGANALTSMIAMPGATTARRRYFATDREAR